MTEKNEKDKFKSKKELVKRDNKKESSQEDLPIPAEVFETLPKEVQVSLRSMYSMQSFSGRAPSPLLEKLTPEHITAILDGSREDSKRDYDFSTSSRWFNLVYAVIVVSLFIFLTFYFGKSDKSLYLDIIFGLIVFAGGFGAGYGYKSVKK